MSIWDNIRDVFKTKEERSDERAQRIGEAVEGETSSGLVDALKELEKQLNANTAEQPDFDVLFPKVVLERVEYTPENDEEIQKRAETEFEGDYRKKVQNTEDYIAEKGESLTALGQNLSEQKAKALSDTAKAVEDVKEKALEQLLKRGLARSSITANVLENYDKAGIEKSADLSAAYDAKLADVQNQISGLEIERKKSLDELDLAHAKEVSDRIEDLKKEQLAIAKEAMEKNNKIAEKQAKLDAERQSDIADYKKQQDEKAKRQAEYEKKYGYTGEKQDNYAKRYDLALQYYLTVDSDIAMQALQSSSNMKYYLGNYYDKLLKVLKDRSANTDRYKLG